MSQMTPPETLASDVADRITQADNESANATAAFAAGRFEEYWKIRADQVMKRVEAAGEQAIADTRGG